jgi:predicted O-linked N-acetylglucosamine transferase (SPINDLY family)
MPFINTYKKGSRTTVVNEIDSRTIVNEKGSRGFGVSSVPTDSFFICSFNANKKMEPISLHAWINVLRRVPWSILLLLDLLVDAKKYLLMEMRYHGRLSVKME